MNFFDLFKPKNYGPDYGRLYNKLLKALGQDNQNELLRCACIAGLMARVAFIDFDINPKEKLFISKALKDWTKFSDNQINLISSIAIDEIKELAGLENHKYCQFLNDISDNDEKYEILVSLFALAGSDDRVQGDEIEEIRLICKCLRLEHKHFISAQATVLEKISSLKN